MNNISILSVLNMSTPNGVSAGQSAGQSQENIAMDGAFMNQLLQFLGQKTAPLPSVSAGEVGKNLLPILSGGSEEHIDFATLSVDMADSSQLEDISPSTAVAIAPSGDTLANSITAEAYLKQLEMILVATKQLLNTIEQDPQLKEMLSQNAQMQSEPSITVEDNTDIAELKIPTTNIDEDIAEATNSLSSQTILGTVSDPNTLTPQVNLTQAQVNVAESQLKAVEPQVNIAESQLKAVEPQVNIAEPQIKVVEPQVNIAEPQVKVAEPQVKVAEPQVKAAVPQAEAITAVVEEVKLAEQSVNDKAVAKAAEPAPLVAQTKTDAPTQVQISANVAHSGVSKPNLLTKDSPVDSSKIVEAVMKSDGSPTNVSVEGKTLDTKLSSSLMADGEKALLLNSQKSAEILPKTDIPKEAMRQELPKQDMMLGVSVENAAKATPESATTVKTADSFMRWETAEDALNFAKLVQKAGQDGVNKLTVRLAPEHLGRLQIQLTEVAGRLDARIIASTQEGKNLLTAQGDLIRQHLADKGIQINSMDFQFHDTSGKQEQQFGRDDADRNKKGGKKGFTAGGSNGGTEANEGITADTARGVYA